MAKKAKPVEPAAVVPEDFEMQLRETIWKILNDNGESFINIDQVGPDKKVVDRVTAEIMTAVQAKPLRVMVAVNGGIIQGALADLANVTLEVHDSDCFDDGDKDDHGRTEEEANAYWEKSQETMHAIY